MKKVTYLKYRRLLSISKEVLRLILIIFMIIKVIQSI